MLKKKDFFSKNCLMLNLINKSEGEKRKKCTFMYIFYIEIMFRACQMVQCTICYCNDIRNSMHN